jgi:hypothetical protein
MNPNNRQLTTDNQQLKRSAYSVVRHPDKRRVARPNGTTKNAKDTKKGRDERQERATDEHGSTRMEGVSRKGAKAQISKTYLATLRLCVRFFFVLANDN